MEKTRIKLQDVILDAVVDESPSMNADVTSKPIEKGQDISDHMKQKPFTVRLSGSMVEDAANKLAILKSYQKDATLLKYTGRNIFENLVLTSLSTKHPVENAEGFDYDITLDHVSIAKPKTFEVNVKNPNTNVQDAKTATKVKEISNAGRQQIQTTNSNVSGRVGG